MEARVFQTFEGATDIACKWLLYMQEERWSRSRSRSSNQRATRRRHLPPEVLPAAVVALSMTMPSRVDRVYISVYIELFFRDLSS